MKRVLLCGLALTSASAWAQNPVSVHVVDNQGVPVSGAELESRFWNGDKWDSRSGKTDVNGDAVLDLTQAVEEKKPASVIVVAKGYAFAKGLIKGSKTEVKLEKGSVWAGLVVDADGKPIAGAKITVGGAKLGEDWSSVARVGGTRFADTFIAKTGADGRFEVADVPAKGLMYGASAPGFAAGRGQDVIAEVPARVELTLGGIFKGKLLGLEGTPLKKVRIFAQGVETVEGYGDAETAEDGTFQIDGLAAGTYNVMVETKPDDPYLVPAQESVRAEKGKTTNLADFQAVEGVLVNGLVRDRVTQKAIAGAAIGNYGPNRPNSSAAASISTKTGEDGKFSVRVVPGSNKFYLYQLPTGYRRSNEQKQLQVSNGAPAQLVFELSPVSVLRGVIKDEAGKPVAATIKVGYESSFQSGADGKWEFTPTEQDKVPLVGGDAADGYFEVIAPKSIDATDAKDVTISVRKKPWQVLPGRVVSIDDTPLEGVQVEATFFSDLGDGGSLSQSTRSAVSNANGDFTLPQIRIGDDAKYLAIKATKAGYAFQKGGDISKNGPVWQTSDLVFTPLNHKVAGMTSPGARVVVAGREMVADEQGRFNFEGLPAGDTLVFAAKDGQFGSGPATDPLIVELKKQEVQKTDPALARQIWTEVMQRATGKSLYSIGWVKAQLAAGGDDLEAQVAAAKDDDRSLLQLADQWAGKADVTALEKVFARIKDPDMRLYAFLSSATKANDPALGKRALQEAAAVFATPEKEVWMREMELYRTAVVATKFAGEQAGFEALDRAVAFTLKNHGEKSTFRDGNQNTTGRDDMFAMQSEVLAAGSFALFERGFSNIDAGAGYDIQALGNAIPILAKNFGFERVMPLLDQLENLPQPPQIQDMNRADHMPEYAFGQAASRVVSLMKKFPDQALQLARRIKEPRFKAQALASAASFQTGETAATLWRQAIAAASSEDVSRYAALAWESNHDLGAELFAAARDKVEADARNEWQGRSVWANYAFYYARVDPAAARLLLEREWGLSMQKKDDSRDAGTLARAMAAIDGKRAWEMAQTIPDTNIAWSLEEGRKIGQYVAASAEKQRVWPFGRWAATDTWEGPED